jgi:hypothetical protein
VTRQDTDKILAMLRISYQWFCKFENEVPVSPIFMMIPNGARFAPIFSQCQKMEVCLPEIEGEEEIGDRGWVRCGVSDGFFVSSGC